MTTPHTLYPPGHVAGHRLDIEDPNASPVPIDTIRALFTYVIALIVITGGGIMLFIDRDNPNTSLSIVIAGFIGSALTFTFGQEVQTRTARQAATATAASAAARTAEVAAANSGVGTEPPPPTSTPSGTQ